MLDALGGWLVSCSPIGQMGVFTRQFVPARPRRFAFFLFAILVLPLVAAPQAEGAGDKPAFLAKITKLSISAEGVLIGTNADETTLKCTAPSDIYLTLHADHPMFDALYSTMLAYQLTGRAVTFRIVDDSQDCEILYASFEVE